MKDTEDINKKVEETLDVLGRIKKADPTPFFYTRLMSRIDQSGRENARPVFKLQYAFYGLVLLLAVNVYSMFEVNKRQPLYEPSMESFIENYQLEVSNIYTFAENEF